MVCMAFRDFILIGLQCSNGLLIFDTFHGLYMVGYMYADVEVGKKNVFIAQDGQDLCSVEELALIHYTNSGMILTLFIIYHARIHVFKYIRCYVGYDIDFFYNISRTHSCI